jgi:DNA-binding CsgD family transcriptional regulator
LKSAASAERDLHAGIVGREPELTRLEEFLASDRQAFVLTGAPGIGKTTLWEAGLELARQNGMRVLRSRPSDAEAQLSFAGLGDLLDGIELRSLTGLPAPQAHALEVALLRSDPGDAAPEPNAIALGLLNAVRSLAETNPVLVAVDDIQWLDEPSRGAFAFAARRLHDHRVRFLIAKRSGPQGLLEQALESHGPHRLELEPLSLGGIRRMLFQRLGLTLPRRTMRRLFEATRGNPLFALELGRTLAKRERLEMVDDLPVPEIVEDLLGMRVAELPAPLRRLLLALAVGGDVRAPQAATIAGEGTLEEALASEVVLLDGDRVRPSHPLLAAAAKGRSPADETRAVHSALAETAVDPESRALHLALAAERPDAELAEILASAATHAAARSAIERAVELAEHALRLTPGQSPTREDRLLALADYLDLDGRNEAITELLTREVAGMRRSTVRARAHLHLAEAATPLVAHEAHLDQALAESGRDPVLRARVLARKAGTLSVMRVSRIAGAEALALDALRAASRAGAGEEAHALYSLGWARILGGQGIDDLMRRYEVLDAPSQVIFSLDRLAAVRLAWRGNIRDARAAFTRLLTLADERAEGTSYATMRLQLCELELRIGDSEAGSRLLDEWEETDDVTRWAGTHTRCRALQAAVRGSSEEAQWLAGEALVKGEAQSQWDVLEALRARGIAALLAREPEHAAESLREVWEHTEREGVEDPGAFPVAPELVEALVELGELEEAAAVTERLRRLAEEQQHLWGLASAKRCDALIRLAAGYDEPAASSLGDAIAAYGQLGLRFDEARALLGLGRALRRHRKRAAARSALERSGSLFEELGSHGWAEQARAELARIGGRGARPTDELTPSEARVVELAANGLSNKEIAQELVVTVRTVEAHLSHAYGKLGIRKRSQLARRLSEQA